jgi:hypothetical protein
MLYLKKNKKKYIDNRFYNLLLSFVLIQKKNINNQAYLNFYNYIEFKLKNYKHKSFFFLNLKYINKKKLIRSNKTKD